MAGNRRDPAAVERALPDDPVPLDAVPLRRTAAPIPAAEEAPAPACSAPRFYGYWLFALAAAVSAFASHIYVRHRVVDLGYRLGQERAQRAQLQNDRRDLEMELASLEAPADLAQVARDGLGLDVPRDDQMIEVATARETASSDSASTAVVVLTSDPDDGPAPVVQGGQAPVENVASPVLPAPGSAPGHAATAVTASLPPPPALPPAPRRGGRPSRRAPRPVQAAPAAAEPEPQVAPAAPGVEAAAEPEPQVAPAAPVPGAEVEP